ncbi:protein trachealess-like [Amphibalanus amphitrite]|uniref:protein trachealess-like n=1 Tax=Amphibalanus amphitrite TaxID=1232801 RepID=UPI001C927718|nr:protein trachealess-like [Amphibalanus amphitrite]
MEIVHPFDFRKLVAAEAAVDSPLPDTRPRDTRKEKSRDAARSRRGKENHEFYELARLLPLPTAITSQLDKASIVRLTLSCLKIGEFSRRGDPPWHGPPAHDALQRGPHIRLRGVPTSIADAYDHHQGTHILQSLDGFAFSLGPDGRFLYVSETVSIYLGLSQVEMCGSSIFDYLHAEDHGEFAELAGLALSHGRPLASPGEQNAGPVGTHNPDVNGAMTAETTGGYEGLERALCVRLKSTLTKRGCHFKTPGYRAMQLQCRLRPAGDLADSVGNSTPLLGLVGLAVALPPPGVHELRLDGHSFVTRLTFDLRIVHCEPRVPPCVDFTSESLVGRSLYSLCHGADVAQLRQAHQDLLTKGQVLTGYYRLLSPTGGYTWLHTCATVVGHGRADQPPSVICVNHVLSHPEHAGTVMESSLLGDHLDLKTDGDPSEQSISEHWRHDTAESAGETLLAGGDGANRGHKGKGLADAEDEGRCALGYPHTAVKREMEMVLTCDTSPAEHHEPPESPRGQKRHYSSVASSPGGGCAPGATCCGDWRRRRRQESGPSTVCRPEQWHGPPAGAARRSVIRSGIQTELPPPAGAEGAALPGPAGFTPPASVSPQEPPPVCGSPLDPGSGLGPRGSGYRSPLDPGPDRSPPSREPSPYGQPFGRSPPRLGPAFGDVLHGLHSSHSAERPPLEAIRSFWFVP